MLAVLLVDAVPAGQTGEWVDRVIASLRLSNAERMRLAPLVEYVQLPLALADHSVRSIHRFWRQVGDAGVDLCLLTLATYLSAEGTALKQGAWLVAVERIRVLLEAFYEKADQLIHPPPLVDGTVLMRELRLKGGPLIGELLEYLLEEQAVGTLQSTEASLEAARVYLANRQQF
jgi:hypothetical protein